MAENTKLICGIKHTKVKCVICGENCWTQKGRKSVGEYICNECSGEFKAGVKQYPLDKKDLYDALT